MKMNRTAGLYGEVVSPWTNAAEREPNAERPGVQPEALEPRGALRRRWAETRALRGRN